MPIYVFECGKCGHSEEGFYSSTAVARPQHCKTAMHKVPSIVGSAFITKGGNWFKFNGASGPMLKGNRKPKVIGTGHGLGGRKPKPSLGGKVYS